MVLRALVLDRDLAVRRQLREALEGPGVRLTESAELAGTNGSGSPRYDVAFIGLPEGGGAEAALQRLAQLPRQLPGVPIVATGEGRSADLVIRALRAGAVEFLRLPASREDAAATLEKVRRLRPGPAPVAQTPGRVTAVYAAKGGLGVTTLAINLAVGLLDCAQSHGKVVLVDLDLAQGAVATCLNLKPIYSVVDMFGQVERLDEALLQGLLAPHLSGLKVLPAPPATLGQGFTPERIAQGVDVIRSHFCHVVLDLPRGLEPGTVAALEAADEVLYLVGLNVPALRSAAANLAVLRNLGLDQRKLRLVVMRADSREDVAPNRVREVLNLPIYWRVPNDYPTVVASLNEGQPLLAASPRSEIARNVRRLVDTLSNNCPRKQGGKGWVPAVLRGLLTQDA